MLLDKGADVDRAGDEGLNRHIYIYIYIYHTTDVDQGMHRAKDLHKCRNLQRICVPYNVQKTNRNPAIHWSLPGTWDHRANVVRAWGTSQFAEDQR